MGTIYPLFNKQYEHYTDCIECCSDLRNQDFNACRSICKFRNVPCNCCDLALKNKKIYDIFNISYKPVARDSPIKPITKHKS